MNDVFPYIINGSICFAGHRTTRHAVGGLNGQAEQTENIPPAPLAPKSKLVQPSSRISMSNPAPPAPAPVPVVTAPPPAPLPVVQQLAQPVNAAGRRSYVVKEVERLKENREKRRARQAEIKEEKVALMNMDPGNPNWELAAMIR